MLENIKQLKEDGLMNRGELNEAMARFFANGGKVTKLPDGPDFRFQPHGVKVKESFSVDVTATEDPANIKQETALEART